MRYRFLTCDVFAERRFAGNPLAVLPEAEGLGTARMQAIAAEFGYSETTFVLPPEERGHLARVRIFTPKGELPFAGHPTVGTALALAWLGRAPADAEIVLGEGAGPVPVRLRGGASAEFAAPASAWRGPPVPAERIARALGLRADEVKAEAGLPCLASCGVTFLLVELAGPAALARARLADGVEPPEAEGNGVFLFTRAAGEAGTDLRARMFAPTLGVPEDPATGSAAAALAGCLGAEATGEGWRRWRIVQGVEMGRPSLIEASARRQGGRVVEVRVAGSAVRVAEGTIEVDA